MSNDERIYTARAMKRYGGSFVKALGECLLLADNANQLRIEEAFYDYIDNYGPTSRFYAAVKKEEA